MEKNIKDYLHLYLGQRCVIPFVNAEGYSAPLTLSIDCYRCAMLPELHHHHVKVLLVLRPLSDMTEGEVIGYLRLKYNSYVGEFEIKLVDNGFWWLFKGIGSNERFKFFAEILDESNSYQFTFLLSKSFDLFGLIPAGLAIEKSTLTQKS